ncbi:hypothetical protein QCB45_10845 [Thiomicrorhabdus sp. ZW0627]|uniref:hypothetical protein n=1 Tax=Thiomicrorhabdus sp. ZW0627 TaxID=3039774 RepID=UPI002436A0AB|nr:hypothetical protein [Thiomicrorhabdus sp. ZW0627]MDG6774830.1 hypothetical protein [Thiomicrorhabdus sp. ZW0627]
MAQAKVIVNETVPVKDVNSLYLKRIYAMQVNKWPNGHPIKVFILPSRSELHKQFSVSKLGIQSYQLDRLWSRLIFTGTGKSPEVVQTQGEMLIKVKDTEGAIGYVAEDFKVDGVRVLSEGAGNE